MSFPLAPPGPHELLNPAMRDVLRRMHRANRPPFHSLSTAQARAAYEAASGVLEHAGPQLARLQDLTLMARDGYPLPVRLFAPTAASNQRLPALLYFHGGGFTVGSVATHDALCRKLSAQSGCAVVSLGYRLAPEAPFPGAVHDAWDALLGLFQHAHAWGLDAQKIAVGGDSAGGTLAAVCAVLARDAGLPLALQLLFYPGCLAQQDSDSHRKFAEGFVLTATDIAWFFSHYLRSSADRDDWRFAPLLAPDVDGVAPAWLGLAECDPLVDEGVLYADKLRAAGVSVDLEIYRGVTHEFIKMDRILPEAQRAHHDAAQAMRAALLSDD